VDGKWYTSIIVGVLALAALAAAVILQLNGDDASKAWDLCAGLAVFFAGVHVPAPTQQ
jgi:hypothetical protein